MNDFIPPAGTPPIEAKPVALIVSTARLQCQLQHAQTEAIASGKGLDLITANLRVEFRVVRDDPGAITLEAYMVGMPE